MGKNANAGTATTCTVENKNKSETYDKSDNLYAAFCPSRLQGEMWITQNLQ